MKNNYHTHLSLCNHAVGEMEDYVLEAIKNNFDELGISDHQPISDAYYTMSFKQYEEIYLPEFFRLKDKYKSKISLKLGLEAEYRGYNVEELKKFYETCDYLLLAVHYVFDKGEKIPSKMITKDKHKIEYKKLLVEGIELGIFNYIAHPDIFMGMYSNEKFSGVDYDVSKEIIEKAIEYDLPLELNANGVRVYSDNLKDKSFVYGYPRKEFWELAKNLGAKVVIGSDCHRVENLNDKYIEECEKFAANIGLNVINFKSRV